jgi:hypothetical protein
MTIYRGRDYQRVMPANVVIPLDLHAPRCHSPCKSMLWQKIVRFPLVVNAPLWKAGPWSVCMTSGEPNRPTWLSITNAVTRAVSHREKASMITRMYSFPCASLGSGPIWSRWRTSNGLYDAQVKGWVFMRIFNRFDIWQQGHCRITHWPCDPGSHLVAADSFWDVVYGCP